MSEQLFGEFLFALHTLSYFFCKGQNKYLYEQDVSCATSTWGLALWRLTK